MSVQQPSNVGPLPGTPNSSSSLNQIKRKASDDAVDDNENEPEKKAPKKRAAKACKACRNRKVRCDVMAEWNIRPDGSRQCNNCKTDGIDCVVEESRRRKRHAGKEAEIANGTPEPRQILQSGMSTGLPDGLVNLSDISNPDARRWSSSSAISNEVGTSGHRPHSIYQDVNNRMNSGEMLRRQSFIQGQYESDPNIVNSLLKSASLMGDRTATRNGSDTPAPLPPTLSNRTIPATLKHRLPDYLKPLPSKMTSVDIDYLYAKGALSIPETEMRNELVTAYFEYVHPYMPLIDTCETLRIIDDDSGASGQLSLLLFQAIMFAGTSFVDMRVLKDAGYTSRKSARKAFFQKARVLYDFDYELDRIALVQSLLLMTYWYETPDDQKDTWHWMGVAISLAHTIGLHRDPTTSKMEPKRQKLWKRIWWSCFMRDRLVALGMRRPTRVKDEDYDVPMLTAEDFETEVPPMSNSIIPLERTLVRDAAAQRELAQLCISKAKLSVCTSHVLAAQYSVLVKHQGMQGQEGATRSSVMLFPKKLDQMDEVNKCDAELAAWMEELPAVCQYHDELGSGASAKPLFVQKSILHMIYFTTWSALHRPQVLPGENSTPNSRVAHDQSRRKVREASREITQIAKRLYMHDLAKYLPTTGVTVLLPAIIIHLLDSKSPHEAEREAAADGFIICMAVLNKLRENYASADFATQFLEAAVKKAHFDAIILAKIQNDLEGSSEEVVANPNKAHEAFMQSRTDRHTPPSSSHDDVQPVFHNIDSQTPAANGLSALTPPEHNDTQAAEPRADFTSQLNGGFDPLNGFDSHNNFDVNMGDYVNDDMWDPNLANMGFEGGAHGEGGAFDNFMDDPHWADALKTPEMVSMELPDIGGGHDGLPFGTVVN